MTKAKYEYGGAKGLRAIAEKFGITMASLRYRISREENPMTIGEAVEVPTYQLNENSKEKDVEEKSPFGVMSFVKRATIRKPDNEPWCNDVFSDVLDDEDDF